MLLSKCIQPYRAFTKMSKLETIPFGQALEEKQKINFFF